MYVGLCGWKFLRKNASLLYSCFIDRLWYVNHILPKICWNFSFSKTWNTGYKNSKFLLRYFYFYQSKTKTFFHENIQNLLLCKNYEQIIPKSVFPFWLLWFYICIMNHRTANRALPRSVLLDFILHFHKQNYFFVNKKKELKVNFYLKDLSKFYFLNKI